MGDLNGFPACVEIHHEYNQRCSGMVLLGSENYVSKEELRMFAEQATFPVLFLLQDAPPPVPIWLLIIIAILLIILFIWLLLRDRRGRQAAASPGAGRVSTMAAAQPPAAAPVAVETPVTVRAAPVVDDLEIIEGIGPKITGVLNQAGITSFAQLAEMDVPAIAEILHQANLRLADPASWPEQARLAANGDMVGLQDLQDRLKGGRQA